MKTYGTVHTCQSIASVTPYLGHEAGDDAVKLGGCVVERCAGVAPHAPIPRAQRPEVLRRARDLARKELELHPPHVQGRQGSTCVGPS